MAFLEELTPNRAKAEPTFAFVSHPTEMRRRNTWVISGFRSCLSVCDGSRVAVGWAGGGEGATERPRAERNWPCGG